MKSVRARSHFDRHTQVGDLAVNLRQTIRRGLLPLAAILGVVAAWLGVFDRPGALAFVLIGAGTLIALGVWSRHGLGLPLLPILVAQHLIAFGLPIAIGHEVIFEYPAEFTLQSGVEVLVFCCCFAGVWLFGMNVFRPSPPVSYALQGFEKQGLQRLSRLGFAFVVITTAFQVLQSMGGLDLIYGFLPNGSFSIINALLSAAGMCGFFLTAMMIGSGALPPVRTTVFWLLLALNCFIMASGFLLSSATTVVGSVFIGLLWSRGRVPWRFLLVVVTALAFLNLGKFTMRDRYWRTDDEEIVAAPVSLSAMPLAYAEWAEASLDVVLGNPVETTGSGRFGRTETAEGQSLLKRVNNLQNLLFVMNAVQVQKLAPLHGQTYSLIPPLLVPRLLWPEKPRTHEGQVLLNVHFGRQDLTSTFSTYVAWGLLAEAYGNFGPYLGSLVLGAALGLLCAWIENLTARKLVLSLEGFLCFTLFIAIANSYEMVASVLVTSIEQTFIPIVLACAPFVQRQTIRREIAA